MSFRDSYLYPIRQKVGSDLLLLPGASCLFVNAAGEVLLERRADFKLWGVPAGSPEPGEDVATSIKREMLEETGVSPARVIPYGFCSDPKTKTIVYPNGHRCQYFVLLFYADWPVDVAPVTSEESLEFGWFKPDALPADLMPSAPATIAAYLRFRETGVFQLI